MLATLEGKRPSGRSTRLTDAMLTLRMMDRNDELHEMETRWCKQCQRMEWMCQQHQSGRWCA